MARLRLQITMNNSAFKDSENPEIEVARILKDAAEKYEVGQSRRILTDINGNSVGFIEYTDDIRKELRKLCPDI